jgi:type IV pilus assembly protein PilE
MIIAENKGFSLLEIVFTLAMAAIVSCFALANYSHAILTAHRDEAKLALMACAAKLEQYYAHHHSYKNATLEKLGEKPITENGHYKITLTAHKQSFLLQATPLGDQRKDSLCYAFSLDETGNYSATGTSSNPAIDCW